MLFQRRPARKEPDDRPRRRGVTVTVSVIVASLLWFTFTMRETHTRNLQIATEVRNIPESQALSQLPPERVRVQVVGDGWSLLRLQFSPPVVAINAAQDEVSVRDALNIPKSIAIQNVSPSQIVLSKERRITREVPIELNVDIRTPATHSLIAPPTVRPDSVEISGAASVVSGIQSWPTQYRRFDNVRDSLIARVPLSDTLRGLVTRNIDYVQIEAVSEHFTEARRVIGVTVQGEPSTRQLVSLEPSSIEVRFNVVSSQYQEAMRAMDFYATVSYDEIRQDTTGRVRPQVHLPEGIIMRDVRWRPERLAYFERID